MAEALTAVEAQEMLAQLALNDYPHMKKPQRQKLHKRLYRKAFPSSDETKPISLEEFSQILAGKVRRG